MRIYLIGFMASGKTRWAKKMANKLNLKFIDLDQCIEDEVGLKVSEIFAEKGEEFFRSKEQEQLKQISNDQHSFVMSVGGGTPCFYDNMELIKESGFSIYLNVNQEMLFGRLKAKKSTRPLIAHMDDPALKQFIEDQLSDRNQYYQQATAVVGPTDINLTYLIDLVNDQLK